MLRAGFLPEAGTVDHHDVFLANQLLDENFITFGNVDSGIRIECSARRNATDTRGRFAPLLGEIAPRPEFSLYFDEMILRAFERGLDRVLLGVIGAQARPQQAVHPFGV